MKKTKGNKIKKVLIKQYFDFPFRQDEIAEDAKMYGNQRVTSIFMCDDTPENKKLAIEHNEVLKQIKELQNKLRTISNSMLKK